MWQYSLPNTEWTCTLDAFITCQVAKKNIKTDWETLIKIREKVRKEYGGVQNLEYLMNWLQSKGSIKSRTVSHDPKLYDVFVALNVWVSGDYVTYTKIEEVKENNVNGGHAMCILGFVWEDILVMMWWEYWVKKIKPWDFTYVSFE